MFEAIVAFELDRVNGIKSMFFGGDGIFLAKLPGPGKVSPQTRPLPKLAGSVLPCLPQPKDNKSTSGGIVSALLDNSRSPPTANMPPRARVVGHDVAGP
jgi:hypothetical protein